MIDNISILWTKFNWIITSKFCCSQQKNVALWSKQIFLFFFWWWFLTQVLCLHPIFGYITWESYVTLPYTSAMVTRGGHWLLSTAVCVFASQFFSPSQTMQKVQAQNKYPITQFKLAWATQTYQKAWETNSANSRYGSLIVWIFSAGVIFRSDADMKHLWIHHV